MILKRGSQGSDVAALQDRLNQLGFAVGVVDGVFGPITESATMRFQKEYNRRGLGASLAVDGIVGPQTQAALTLWDPTGTVPVAPEPGLPPQNARDQRLSDALKLILTADGGGCRYAGWSSSGIKALEQVEAKRAITIPKGTKVDPEVKISTPYHGGTCSPFAGIFMGWLLSAYDFTWRIGRSADWIATWSCHGKTYNGSLHRGFAEYCTTVAGGWHSNTLGELWDLRDKLSMVTFIEMSHHCIFVLNVGGSTGMNVLDPWTGKPCPAGLYRFGADGFYVTRNGIKYYSGTRTTFRLLDRNEKTSQKWKAFRVTDLLPDGTTADVPGGRYNGTGILGLVLE